MKKVSIIVPVYNSQNTLVRALGSLVNQTLEDIEIIIVNDASTDATWEIMKECEKQFPDKIVIVDGGTNRGSGGARNQGFDLANGEYIGLVDSDDYVASNMYELLYNEAKRGDYDIVDCGYYREAKDEARIYTSDELTGELDDNKRKALIRGGGYLTTKIFKKELWNDPPIRMREKVKCLEDTEILIYMFLRAKNIGNVKEVLYNYCNSEGSTSKTRDLDEYFNSVYGAMGAVYEVCGNRPEYAGCREMIEYAMARMYSYGINRCIYDRIVEYGASPDKVKSYFDSLGEKEVEMLNKLAELRIKVLELAYDDNSEIMSRITPTDIAIMRECDNRYGRRYQQ